MRVLVVNTGSSSLKLRLLGTQDEILADTHVDRWEAGDAHTVAEALEDLPPADAIGHRVVHGGSRFPEPTRVDEAVERAIDELTPLAPLHQPRALAGIRAVREALSDVEAVACFDTSYHAALPEEAATYALPEAWRRRFRLRRYGFHGLSHAYAARRAGDMLDRHDLRAVTCHLGAGASLCASRAGRSVDTTMGFTPLEGLVMATRSGSVDPGLVLWLITEAEMDPSEVSAGLEHDAGLAGLSGTSGDMRDVLERRSGGDRRAALGFDVYVHRLVQGVAAMAASLGGLDALVFTGGVGEHAVEVRAAAVERLAFLGATIDTDRNADPEGDAHISAEDVTPAVLVVEAREDLEISRQTRSVLATAVS